jgi:hypothetical protein
MDRNERDRQLAMRRNERNGNERNDQDFNRRDNRNDREPYRRRERSPLRRRSPPRRCVYCVDICSHVLTRSHVGAPPPAAAHLPPPDGGAAAGADHTRPALARRGAGPPPVDLAPTRVPGVSAVY